jgi:hypothetical protein
LQDASSEAFILVQKKMEVNYQEASEYGGDLATIQRTSLPTNPEANNILRKKRHWPFHAT